MRSNHFESIFGFTCFGESHGKAIGVVVEDVIPNVDFPYNEIQQALDKRKPNKQIYSTQRLEKDKLVVLSGVFEGKTTGTPICMLVYNNNHSQNDYEQIRDVFRPGHADLSFYKKFKIYDYRGGGRASGRETIARVAAGAMLDRFLGSIDIIIFPIQIGKIKASQINQEFISSNPLYWPDEKNYQEVLDFLSKLRSEKKSTGGIVKAVIKNLPSGLGDPVFEKLDACIAKAIVSLGSVKGIEFGEGFSLADKIARDVNPELFPEDISKEISNIPDDCMGGIYGGITVGRQVNFKFVVKPVPSVSPTQNTINKMGQQTKLHLDGRFDICVIPRIIPAAEAMIKLVLADALSIQNYINQKEENIPTLREKIDKVDEDILISLHRRISIVKKLKEYKEKNSISAEDKDREDRLIERLKKISRELKIEPRMIEEIWEKIIKFSKLLQQNDLER